jgi:hypothetical protein
LPQYPGAGGKLIASNAAAPKAISGVAKSGVQKRTVGNRRQIWFMSVADQNNASSETSARILRLTSRAIFSRSRQRLHQVGDSPTCSANSASTCS